MWDSLRRRLAFSKSPNPSPSSSPSRYHESPSGLLIPDALSLSPSQSVRFGDIWSNDWMGTEYVFRCDRCKQYFAASTSHHCSVGYIGTTAAANTKAWNQIREDYKALAAQLDARARRVASSFDPEPLPMPEPALPVEKRTMPVIGYRAWKTDRRWELGYGHRARLTSTGIVHEWGPGVNEARCGGYVRCHSVPLHTNSPIPNEYHQCGLYVVADVPGVQRHVPTLAENHVVGAVLGWGKVVQHGDEGWRAQYARVIALMDMKLSEKNDEIAHAISEAYGVPILGRDALERYVSEFGDPVKGD